MCKFWAYNKTLDSRYCELAKEKWTLRKEAMIYRAELALILLLAVVDDNWNFVNNIWTLYCIRFYEESPITKSSEMKTFWIVSLIAFQIDETKEKPRWRRWQKKLLTISILFVTWCLQFLLYSLNDLHPLYMCVYYFKDSTVKRAQYCLHWTNSLHKSLPAFMSIVKKMTLVLVIRLAITKRFNTFRVSLVTFPLFAHFFFYYWLCLEQFTLCSLNYFFFQLLFSLSQRKQKHKKKNTVCKLKTHDKSNAQFHFCLIAPSQSIKILMKSIFQVIFVVE